MPNGEIITTGGDLSTTIVSRFGRGFINAFGGGMKEYLHCVCCEDSRVYVRCSDGGVLITPKAYELYL